jgi:hypothetical protein
MNLLLLLARSVSYISYYRRRLAYPLKQNSEIFDISEFFISYASTTSPCTAVEKTKPSFPRSTRMTPLSWNCYNWCNQLSKGFFTWLNISAFQKSQTMLGRK